MSNVFQTSCVLSYLSSYLMLLILSRLGTRMLSLLGGLLTSVGDMHLDIVVLLQQSHHLQPKTKAQDVSSNGSAVGMDDLLAVDLLSLHPDTSRWTEGGETLEMLNNLVVGRVG